MNPSGLEIIIIGAGMAGASAACELALTHRVGLLEGEQSVGFHSTGRSAALFSETYGNAVVRALTRASRLFFCHLSEEFSSGPVLRRRGVLLVASASQAPMVEQVLREHDLGESLRQISSEDAITLCPALRPEAVAGGALYDEEAADIDVNALHHGYLRQFRERGGILHRNARVTAVQRRGGFWRLESTAGEFQAPILVNAAGAWADHVAGLAGIEPRGIQSYRRTIAIAQIAGQSPAHDWPMTLDVTESYYFKPEAGQLLLSPADETPIEACDVQPLDIDVATAVERVEQATRMTIERVRRAWAGLRSFSPDRTPVIGLDPHGPQFFWLAGQGGYGIQTAPAAASLIGSLIRGTDLSAALTGFDLRWVSPSRFATHSAPSH